MRKTAIMWFITLVVASCLGFVAGARHARREPGRVSVASVNGEVITQEEFENALKLVVGQEVLRLLCTQKVVMQEAQRRGISVSDSEVEQARKNGRGLSYGDFKLPDEATQEPGFREVVNQEVRAGLIMRKMVLKDVSESWKRHIYELFRDELTQYELYCILVPSQTEAEVVASKLKQGVSFAELAASYSLEEVSKNNGGRVGFMTQPALQTLLGPEASETLLSLKPGATSKSIPTPVGVVFLKIGTVRSTYDELKPAVEEIFVESKRLAVLQELITGAELVSPFGAKIQAPKYLAPPDPKGK